MADHNYSKLSLPDDCNTTSFYDNEEEKVKVEVEKVEVEVEEVESDCDDTDKDPNYIYNIQENSYIDQLSTTTEELIDTELVTLRKRRVSSSEKYFLINLGNTTSFYDNEEEKVEVEVEEVESDCDDTDKDPNYIYNIQENSYINQLSTTTEELIDTELVTFRKRRVSSSEKYCKKMKMKEIQNKKQMEKHPVIPKTCKDKCFRQCSLLNNEHQATIWANYWRQGYTERRKYLSKCVTLAPVKQRKVSKGKSSFKKNMSRFYSFAHPELSVEISICKQTFLQTLGYTNDSVITQLVAAMGKDTCGRLVKENRGRPRVDTINRDVIIGHIESYHPCVSHYRRHNAPNARYLPRELTLKDMFNDFSSKHPNYCDIETYRTTLKRQNVSLNQPKADDCEDCTILVPDLTTIDQTTNSALERHKIKANKANAEYKKDSEEKETDLIKFYSMDLQKVILIPFMPNIKASYFISRLVVFNETFATIKKGSSFNSYCVLWHEAINGRKAECIADSILKVIAKERDVTKFVFWADNCAAQNKNWILYSALVTTVNQVHGPKEIIIKYLTKGHTHMSADGLHGNIESKIRRKGKIYDFDDLVQNIGECRSKVEVLKLEAFYSWKSKKRTTNKTGDPLKNFKLTDVVMVRFIRGSFGFEYKYDFEDNLTELDFIQKSALRNIKNYPQRDSISVRGVKGSKKKEIIKSLVPFMPENRKIFWQTLPDSENVLDLVHEEDYGLSTSITT